MDAHTDRLARRSTAARAARLVGWLSALLAGGSLLLALAHAGLSLPLLSRLGPGGDRVVVPAVVAFTVAFAAATAVTVGAFRRRRWAWSAGLAVHFLAVVAAATSFRGAGSAAGIALGAVTVAVLLSPAGRQGLLSVRHA